MQLITFLVWPLFLSLGRSAAVPSLLRRAGCDGQCINQELGPLLSKGATILHNADAASRWSEYHAPMPGTVINVASELDVLITVSATFRLCQLQS